MGELRAQHTVPLPAGEVLLADSTLFSTLFGADDGATGGEPFAR
jgi:hypothetical protein